MSQYGSLNTIYVLEQAQNLEKQLQEDINRIAVLSDLYQFHKVALDITPPNPPLLRGGEDFIHSTSLEKWYYKPRSKALLAKQANR